MGVTISDNKQGNKYHSSETGQFTSAQGGGDGGGFGENGSISVIPKTTSAGKPRRFFNSYSPDEIVEIFERYNANHGRESQKIKELGMQFPTDAIKSDSREMLRQKIVQEEFESQNPENKRKEKKATIILGLPGSGKSRIANMIANENGAFIIDADNFKQRIPEFQKDQLMLSAVHGESVDLSNRFRNELGQEGYNMIIGKVGGDIDSVDYVVKELAEQGYGINVILNDVPLEVAMDRTIGRFDRKETDRLVPIHTLLNADGKIFGVFDYLLQHPNVSSGKVYSNDVPKEQTPVLLKEYTK